MIQKVHRMRKKQIQNSPIFNSDVFPNPIDLHVGQKLRERRVRTGMSQEKLAEATNVTFQQIQKYESAKNRISASRLFQFSVLLSVPVDYFFEGIDLSGKSNHIGLSDNGQEAYVVEDQQQKQLDKDMKKLNKAFTTISDEKVRKIVLDNILSTIKLAAKS